MKYTKYISVLVAILILSVFYIGNKVDFLQEKKLNAFSFYIEPSLGLPILLAKNGKNEFQLLLDTGCETSIILNDTNALLCGVNYTGKNKFSLDVKGEVRESKGFILKSLSVGNHVFYDVLGAQWDSSWLKNSHVKTDEEKRYCPSQNGLIGRGLFKNKLVVMDSRNHTFLILDSVKELLNKGYPQPTWIPCLYNNVGIIFDATMNNNKIKLILDTGSNYSVIRSDIVKNGDLKNLEEFSQFISSEFEIGNINYKEVPFILYNFKEPCEVDGIIGADFLKNHQIFLNFNENAIFIN